MTTKKYVIIYNENKNLIGYREHHFDWKEGDDIVADGISCTIFAIFEGTQKNIRLASEMMKTINRYMPKYSYERVIDKPTPAKAISIENPREIVDAYVHAIENSHVELVQTRKKTWKNFDAILDFVEEFVNDKMD